MKQYIFKWLNLSLFFLLVLSSCKKDKLAKMKKGKYEMINIRTFSDGHKDTIQCLVYGPRVLKHHYYFSPEIENKVLDKIDVAVGRRRMLVNGPFPKRVESVNIRFYSENFPLPGYFGGSVESYDLQESQLVINYVSESVHYSTWQKETAHSGTVQFNWVGL